MQFAKHLPKQSTPGTKEWVRMWLQQPGIWWMGTAACGRANPAHPKGASWMGCHLQGRIKHLVRGQTLRGSPLAGAGCGLSCWQHFPLTLRSRFSAVALQRISARSCRLSARCLSHRRMIIGDCNVTRQEECPQRVVFVLQLQQAGPDRTGLC